MGISSVALLALGLSASAAEPISVQEVIDAQEEWGQGIVEIGEVYTSGGDYTARATEHLDTLYAYDIGIPVLFKPTLASEDLFRTDFDSALTYFVGSEEPGHEDDGFAIAPYTNVEFDTEEIFTNGDTAMSMGTYDFTTPEGEVITVEYSFGYVRDKNGDLRIVLHHSSLPFRPEG